MKHQILVLVLFLTGLFSIKTLAAVPSIIGISSADSIALNRSDRKAYFHFQPTLGLTFGSSKVEGVTETNIQWLGTINSDFNYIGKKFDLGSTLFMQYGERKTTGQQAQKLQDAFILSITPSIPIIKLPAIRLFLETTAETNLGKGTIGHRTTSFLDPLFLYQTLFLGQKHFSYQKGDQTTWDLTYGLGYAFQQTLNKNFETQNDLNGNRSDFDSGFSAIVQCNVNSRLTQSINFVLNAKAVALSRSDFFKDVHSSRSSALIRSGFYFKQIGIEYIFHYVHDLNLSAFDTIDQSLMLTLRF